MPRTKLDETFNPKAPPIDWTRAAVLERQAVMGFTTKQLAEIGGISYDRMRHLIRLSPWDWPSEVRSKVCRTLGVKLVRSVEGAPT